MSSVVRTDADQQVLCDEAWLDLHLEACRPEYEEMLRSVGLQPGWHVLDAGCGSGGLLPTLRDIVGAAGRVVALDADARHVEALLARQRGGLLKADITILKGGLCDLPLPSGELDAVWCANVLQYLDDLELAVALAELRRVVRPGGLIAVKDVDMLLARVEPGDPAMLARLADASARAPDASAQSRGSLRGRALRGHLIKAGLERVQQRTVMIESWAPLRPAERQLWDAWLEHLSSVALALPLSAESRASWERLALADGRAALLDAPDFYACEGQVVAVGWVP